MPGLDKLPAAHQVAIGAYFRAGDPEWYPEQVAPEHRLQDILTVYTSDAKFSMPPAARGHAWPAFCTSRQPVSQ